MKASVHGTITAPMAIVVGAWDPMVRVQQDLFKDLGRQARLDGLSSVVVVFDPDPALVLRGRAKWPVYDDIHTRVHYIRAAGVDAAIHLHFTEQDLEAGAAEFFAILQHIRAVKQLWLGAHQSLGRGPAGSQNAIIEIAEEQDVAIRRLPIVTYSPSPYDLRQNLIAGKMAEVTQAMGRAPIRRRPRSGRLRVAWAPGCYLAIPLDHPTATPAGRPIAVEVEPVYSGFRMPRLIWPDPAIRFLAFVRGPGDDLAARTDQQALSA